MKRKRSDLEKLQDTIRTAVALLTTAQKKQVLEFIRLLRQQWNGELQEGIGLLTEEECRRVLEEIALMPGEGRGRIYPKDDKPLL